MRYALIIDSAVKNIIWLNADNAKDFSNAVLIEDGMCIGIGDTYTDGRFYHDGKPVLTKLEQAQATIAELDAALLDATFELLAGGGEM